MRFQFQGIEVEVDGVSRSDLPDAFDFEEVITRVVNGEFENVTGYMYRTKWIETSREQEFWSSWVQ